MSVVESIMLIKADAGNNNNKFYDLRLMSDDTVVARYGRVGANGQTKSYRGGKRKYDKLIEEKTKPENPRSKKGGYTLAKVMTGKATAAQGNLADLATKQIKYSNCKETAELIKKLVKWNVHQITSHSTMTVDISSGKIQLPSGMGVLTQEAIDDARAKLRAIDKLKTTRDKNKDKFSRLVNSYLMLVPQVIPSKKGWIDYIFQDGAEISAQEGLLDSLEGTLSTIGSSSENKAPDAPKIFDLALVKVNDKSVEDKICALYKSTNKRMHQSSSLDVSGIYEIQIGYMADAYQKCAVSNPMELWHGTGIGNLLSILKSGLIIPSHASHGRLYGNGVYFSDQSTKALNYAAGYWSGNRTSNCFMFLADVKMGKTYTPSGYGSRYSGRESYPVSGYDSTFAKGGMSGVINNEMIVYQLNQINLKYLVEFE